MALANNPLLTALTAAKAQKASTAASAKTPEPVKDKASSFSSVFAKQAAPKPNSVDDSPSKPVSAKTTAADSKNDDKQASAASDKTVADNGNGLPAKSVHAKDSDDGKGNSSDGGDDDDDSEDDTTEAVNASDAATVADGTVTAPVIDPTLLVSAPQPPVPPVVDAQPVVDPALLAAAAPTTAPVVAAPVVQAPTTDADDHFDPSADPLEGLTAVQVALQNKTQQTAQLNGHTTDASKTDAKQDPNADAAQMLAGTLAAVGDKPSDKDTTESGGDKAFSGLLADGLKDVKTATSDTRVDNFAERLAALSQAAQVKTSAPAPAPLINQPLAMNQSGWTEGVVNRVMYLSSQNLKQADIQLQPAELGRLDIRVNMAADQQTQITFMSAHVGVREALENQMSRLRDSFVQQGLGQVNVNVSDQSQGWQQQAQQQQSGESQRGNGARGVGSDSDLIADGAPVDAASAAASAPLTVVGSSAVDYYA